jgi:hypothetical protein
MARRLPEPIVPSCGYCISWGFESRLPAVPFNHPSIVSNNLCFNGYVLNMLVHSIFSNMYIFVCFLNVL